MVGKKANKPWIWIALTVTTRQVIACALPSSERNARRIEWLRLGPDVIFIRFGSIPITLAALTAYRYRRRPALRSSKMMDKPVMGWHRERATTLDLP